MFILNCFIGDKLFGLSIENTRRQKSTLSKSLNLWFSGYAGSIAVEDIKMCLQSGNKRYPDL